METLIDSVLSWIAERRKNVLSGNVNCIPSRFTRFRKDFVGVEQGKYYLISAAPKCCKTQFTSYMFLYTVLDYAFLHPEILRVKIFYFPLEESKDMIIIRYMSHLLYQLSEGRIRISPEDLKSTNEKRILPEAILNLLGSFDYRQRLQFFEDHVEFSDERNPTGMWKLISNYADLHGKKKYKDIEYTDTSTGEIVKHKKFDRYIPDDSNEYVFWYIDHLSLLQPERGMDLRETINKCSEYGVIVRNKYRYSPVFVQQQSTETSNLEAFKNKKIIPTPAGLADSKYTAKDCNVMLGLCNPYSYEIPSLLEYDITRFKDNLRFLKVCVNRDGTSDGIIALYFDGAVSQFSELPPPKKVTEIAKWYNFIENRDKIYEEKNGISFFSYVEEHRKSFVYKLHRFFK